MTVAVRVRDPGDRAWEWVGDNFQLTPDRAAAFTYADEYRHVAEEVVGRAENAGLIAEVVTVPESQP